MSNGEIFEREIDDREILDRERFNKYLISIFNIFSNNVPQIIIPKESIIGFTDKLTYEQIQNALNSPGTLDDIIINLIRKFTNQRDEPLWGIQSYVEKQYFIPSDEAIYKYNLQSKGEDGYFLNSNFEIQPPLQPSLQKPKKKIFFKGGKKSKRRRTRSKSTYKKSYNKRRTKRRTKSTFRKS